MNQENLGRDVALARQGVPLTGLLNKDQATVVLKTCWPKAPEVEVLKAAILCRDFGLHPLMKHVYLIPYKTKDGKETWSMVIGIGATRLMMSRRGSFSYVDDTPRIMASEEQERIFGFVDEKNIVAITKLQTRDGLKSQGYGKYPREGGYLMGEDKGNTRQNMAFIRSERNAFDRLFPDTKLPEVEVIDESYMDTPDYNVDTETGEIKESEVIEPEPEPEKPKAKKQSLVIETYDPNALKQAMNFYGIPLKEVSAMVKAKGWQAGKVGELNEAQLKEIIEDMEKAVVGEPDQGEMILE